MTNIRIWLDKAEFEKKSKEYLKAYDKNEFSETGTSYQIDDDICIDNFEINDNGINFSGSIGDDHWVSVDLGLDDDDFLGLLKVVLSKMNKWKEAMKAIKTVKEIEIKKEKKK